MKKEGPKGKITGFDDYVENYCKGVTVDEAKKYAKEGKRLLKRIYEQENASPRTEEALVEDSAHLMWYLVRSSFEVGYHFGKGMFILQMPSDEETERLYQYFRHDRKSSYTEDTLTNQKQRTHESLKKTATSLAAKTVRMVPLVTKNEVDPNPTYSRTSSHFNNFMLNPKEGHFGIDARVTPLPLSFKTTAFGLLSGKSIKDPNKRNSVYLKPETEGADIKRNPGGSIIHGANLAKTMVLGGEKIPGLGRFAEDGNGYGDAIRFQFNGENLIVLNPPNIKKVSFEESEEVESEEEESEKDLIENLIREEPVRKEPVKKGPNLMEEPGAVNLMEEPVIERPESEESESEEGPVINPMVKPPVPVRVNLMEEPPEPPNLMVEPPAPERKPHFSPLLQKGKKEGKGKGKEKTGQGDVTEDKDPKNKGTKKGK